MATSNLGFSDTGPGFDDPMGMLHACHRRVVRHCELLERVASHLSEGDAGEQVQQAAAQVVRYFSKAGPNHHADEDEDLFPRLQGRDPILDSVLEMLEAEHRTMAERWAAIEAALADVAAIEDPQRFAADVAAFNELYRNHVDWEERDVYPRAPELLEADELEAIGRSMAARRGVEYF